MNFLASSFTESGIIQLIIVLMTFIGVALLLLNVVQFKWVKQWKKMKDGKAKKVIQFFLFITGVLGIIGYICMIICSIIYFLAIENDKDEDNEKLGYWPIMSNKEIDPSITTHFLNFYKEYETKIINSTPQRFINLFQKYIEKHNLYPIWSDINKNNFKFDLNTLKDSKIVEGTILNISISNSYKLQDETYQFEF